jgi:hypothetical protein
MKEIKARYAPGGRPEYYWERYYNDEDSLDLHLLFSFLTYLSNTNYEYWYLNKTKPCKDLTFEDYKQMLFEKGEIWSSDSSFIHNVAGLEPHNKVGISSTYTSDDDQEQLENYEYIMDLDDFLEVLKNFIDNALLKTPYIIVYEDDNKKMHCETYKPTPEELKEWGEHFPIDLMKPEDL